MIWVVVRDGTNGCVGGGATYHHGSAGLKEDKHEDGVTINVFGNGSTSSASSASSSSAAAAAAAAASMNGALELSNFHHSEGGGTASASASASAPSSSASALNNSNSYDSRSATNALASSSSSLHMNAASSSSPSASASSSASCSGSGAGAASASAEPRPVLQLLYNILSNRQTWVFCAFGLFAYTPLSVLADMWATRFVAHAWATDTAAAAFTVSFVYIGVGVGAPALAWFSTQLQSHRKPMALGVGGCLFWVCVVLYGPFVPFSRLPLLWFGVGFCVSCQSLAFSAVVTLNPRQATGTASAVQNMVCVASCFYFVVVVLAAAPCAPGVWSPAADCCLFARCMAQGCMISGMVFQPVAGLLLDYKHRVSNASVLICCGWAVLIRMSSCVLRK